MLEKKHIVVLPGEGIGPEIMAQGVKLLQAFQEPLGMTFTFEEPEISRETFQEKEADFPEAILKSCQGADAILIGTVGNAAPEARFSAAGRTENIRSGLLERLGYDCNIRLAVQYHPLEQAFLPGFEQSGNLNVLFVNYFSGGRTFYGLPTTEELKDDRHPKIQQMFYSAFELAGQRRCSITRIKSDGEAGVSHQWQEALQSARQQYPDVHFEDISLRRFRRKLLDDPEQLDVILMDAQLSRSGWQKADIAMKALGRLPSAYLGDGPPIYEAGHGAAIALSGRNAANPIAMISAIAMMIRHSFKRPMAALAIEDAVQIILNRGYYTADIPLDFGARIGTRELGACIAEEAIQNFTIPYLTV